MADQPSARPLVSPWLAMEVRPWLVLAIVLLIAAGGLSGLRMNEYLRERRVIESGPVVDATIQSVGAAMAHEGRRDETLQIEVSYKTPDGQDIRSSGELPRKPGEMVTWKQTIPIHIDPADPTWWTARDEPAPLGMVLTVPLLCLPAAVLCGAIAWLRQRTMAKVAAGESVSATVTSVKMSSLAPMSKLIGVTITAEDSRRILHCYWPSSGGAVKAGDSVHVLRIGKHVLPARLV